ncbi:YlqD family protein [Halobacillus halophilus]|uniref:YlqD family protein n=1 Tax=Halobacillus halophilus TaxID=1570 RepID=UPI001CD5468F|nr:YlqD family protein [Halobacillus halophilus]MCA1009211.1 YlqD family protein [Halobacillus halophilus]
MQIIRKVPVKQVLTESSREILRQRFEKQSNQLDQECRQLAFEQKKLERKPGMSKQEVEKRFSKEIDRRKHQMQWIAGQLKQLSILPDQSELETDEVEAILTVEEGDDWKKAVTEQQIIIKDGKVIRAR